MIGGWTFVLFWSKTSLKTLRPRTSSFRFLLKTAPINPIGLIPTRSHRFNKSIDRKIIFQSHAELSDRPSLGNLVGNLQDKHLGYPSTAVLFHHAERNKSDEPNFPAIIQE